MEEVERAEAHLHKVQEGILPRVADEETGTTDAFVSALVKLLTQ